MKGDTSTKTNKEQAAPLGTRRIPLTKDKWAIVDEADYETVKGSSWRAMFTDGKWYALRGVNREAMHRVIMGARRGEIVDHQNGDSLDNRRCNLRVCRSVENSWNSKPHRDKVTSKFKGVAFLRDRGKYRAQIMCQSKKINLGDFPDEVSAARAYDQAARRLHGNFARVNFPGGEL
jgi:hypothetical protein